MKKLETRRTLFEVNNARTQSVEEVAKTFSAPDSFWRLVLAKNHVILGSRGSGKTAVIRMLSHEHITLFDHPRARELVAERVLVGTYVPMRAEWVGTLKNKPWQSEAQKEAWFQWRLNLSCCSAFVDTAASCFRTYLMNDIERLTAEKRFCEAVSQSWSDDDQIVSSLRALRQLLEDIEWHRQVEAACEGANVPGIRPGRRSGAAFDVELFGPLRRAIALLKREIEFPDATVWALCLDEIEFLDASHHRILNSHMRSSSGNMFFKMTTMPYFHHTLGTNTAAAVVPGHDFEYVYLDYDPSVRGTDKESWERWAEKLLDKRLRYFQPMSKPFSFERYFGGRTPLLDPKPSDWTADSEMMGLLRKYAAPEVFFRAGRLSGAAFRDQVSRKLHGALMLRNTMERLGGNREHEMFGGPRMFVRCSDANPRQLFRLFHELAFRNPHSDVMSTGELIDRPSLKQQTRILIDYSKEALSYVASEEEIGHDLVRFVEGLCEYFQYRFHETPLRTDYYYAVHLDGEAGEKTWKLVKYAVGLGLLFPKVAFKKPEMLPNQEGDFNLAFRLAPAYGLLPRRGKSVQWRVIKNWLDHRSKKSLARNGATAQQPLGLADE